MASKFKVSKKALAYPADHHLLIDGLILSSDKITVKIHIHIIHRLLTTEISIGRKTKQSPLTAYSKLKKGWGFLGIISCLVPVIIMPYYCVIGGWVVKYFVSFITGQGVGAVSYTHLDVYKRQVFQ